MVRGGEDEVGAGFGQVFLGACGGEAEGFHAAGSGGFYAVDAVFEDYALFRGKASEVGCSEEDFWVGFALGDVFGGDGALRMASASALFSASHLAWSRAFFSASHLAQLLSASALAAFRRVAHG